MLEALILALTLAGIAPQAKKAEPTPADRAIRDYLKVQANKLEKDFLPEVKTSEDFEKLRPSLREQYYFMLGLAPLPEKTPLNPVVTGRLDFPDFTVEKLHFQSRPGLYVTADLYLPKPVQVRHPAVLYSCGHSNKGRDGNKTAYQDHGIWFATHGYVCLVLDSLQLGEIGATHHGTYKFQRWWWHSAGYTPAGVECWNAIRAIDYLQSRPEVDPDRIGATGISGGGAATGWISAADDRIKASAPVSGMADLGYYAGEDGVDGHCDCMFLYNNARWNWTVIPALVCPRPLIFVNSDNDGIFPMSANERVINRLERLYARFGASDRVDAMVSIGGHAYRTDLRRAIFEFFNRHLRGDSRPVADPDAGLSQDGKPTRIPSKDLRVFPEDTDLPKDQINTRIDETFVEAAKIDPPKAGEYETWKKDLLDRLKKTCFGAWPASPPMPEKNAQSYCPEEGIQVPLSWHFTSGGSETRRWMIVLGLEEKPDVLPDWSRDIVGDNPVLLLKPRGGWTRKNPPNTVERSMALLGTTVEAGRVWDIIAAARGRESGISILGRGTEGILAAYAALYEPSIREVTILDPPATHREGPHFLSVLRVLDIPEALGCLAPRPLTLRNAKDPAFDRTAEIYKAAGSPDRFLRK
jgi:dienelactone hydrolase